MADISQTAANVALGGANVPTRIVQYGESVTQGMPVYRSDADSKYYQCDANDTAAKAVAAGIAISPGATNSYGVIALPASGPGKSLVNLGATLAVGTAYAVSAKGAIAPIADLGTGEYITILGVATTTALLDLQIVVSNTAKA
jgi:hypothetical protein